MLAISHTIISLPFGIYMENPLLIFLAAFVFHFFADTFLHWNIYPDDYPRFPFGLVTLDVGGGIIAAWLLTSNGLFSLPVLMAIIGGNMPDIIHMIWTLVGKRVETEPLTWKSAFFHFHERIQQETPAVVRGIIPQIIMIVIAVLLIKY